MKKTMAQLAAVLLTSWTMGVVGSPVYAAMTGNDTNGYLEINDAATHTESVYGWNKTGMEDAVDGKVIIGGSPVFGQDVSIYGGVGDQGNAIANAVTISGGTYFSAIHGGFSTQGNATNNVVTINSGDFQGEISGGTSEQGDAIGNSINASGGTFSGQGNIYGGSSDQGNAIDNTVAITNGSLTGQSVFGGYANQNGNVFNNRVALTNTTGGHHFFGGYANQDGAVSHNTVVLSGVNLFEGAVGVDINGGISHGNGEVSDNTVIIKGDSKIEVNNLTGGSGRDGGAQNNHVIISDTASISGDTNVSLSGGSSNSGLVTGNSITVSDQATVSGPDLMGGQSTSGEAIKNSVSILGGTVDRVMGGYSSDSNANENQVIVSQGTVNGYIYGGYSKKENANGNHISITGGTIGSMAAGYAVNGEANNNVIRIMGGTVQEPAPTKSRNIVGGRGSNADGNQIYLSGGQILGKVVGGWIDGNSTETADDNLIQLSGDADVSEANLYGAYSSIGTGNSLVIDNWANHDTQIVQNFNDITFKSVQWENGGTVLNITGETELDKLKDTAVNVNNLVLANNQTLHVNDSMTFIQSSAETGLAIDNVNVNEEASFTQGVATVGTLEMQLEGATDNLIGKIISVERNPQTNIILDNRVAGTAFVNQGADIAADSMDLLMNDHKYGVRTFGAVYGSRSKYDVDSDLKINGWNTILGVGNVHRRDHADLAWGVFYENSTGNYRVMNRFSDEFFRGDGSLVYNGGGAAVRYKKDSGTYYEASLRVGTLNSSMSNAVKDGNGTFYGYDSDSTYWGTHLGIGKLIQNGNGEWNLYGKYFHTEIEGDSFAIGGDKFAFDDVTSDRLRLGARYTTDTSSNWGVYYGLAWEYEFNGDSNMKAGQFEAPEKGLQGSTGIAEIGTTWRSEESPWGADINLKGYTGEREGFSGMVYLTYMF